MSTAAAPPPDSIAGKARRTSMREFLTERFGEMVTSEMVEMFIAEADAERALEGRVS